MEVRESVFQAGRLEILRYLPPTLLEGIELDDMDLDEFLSLLAQARYLEDLESGVIARAIAAAFEQ